MADEPGIWRPVARKISRTTTVDSDKKLQFRDTGVYIQSNADGKLTISSDGTGSDDITLSGTVTGDANWSTTGQVSSTGDVVFNTGTATLGKIHLGVWAAGTTVVTSIPGTAVVINGGSAETLQLTPTVGRLIFVGRSGGVGGSTNVVLTTGTWDGTNGTAAVATATGSLIAVGVSSTRMLVLSSVSTAFPD